MECRRYLYPCIFIETSHINYDIINLGRLLSLYNFAKFLSFSIFPVIPSVAWATQNISRCPTRTVKWDVILKCYLPVFILAVFFNEFVATIDRLVAIYDI